MNFPWLLLILLTPLVGTILLFVPQIKKFFSAKQIAFYTAIVTLVFVIVAGLQFDVSSNAQTQLDVSFDWIPIFGISFHLALTGISLVLVGLTAVLTPIVVLACQHEGQIRSREYFMWILLTEASALAVFMARDLFLFYVVFEAMLIPIFFLVGRFGGARKNSAALKFLLFGLVGGLVMLAAVIWLYFIAVNQLGRGTFSIAALSNELKLDTWTERWLFLGFFLAFALKAPMVPGHTWLPDTAEQATPGTSTMLIGILDKVGTYAMLAILIPIFPNASKEFAPAIIILALVSIIYAALIAIAQKDMKRTFAYISISHFGFIVMGIFSFTSIGIIGATVYMLAHGLSTAALFLTAGYLMRQKDTSLINNFGGLTKTAPLLTGFFLVASLSSIALPGLAGFVGEFMVLTGTYQRNQIAAVIATLGIILAAIYMLWLYQRVFTGPENDSTKNILDLNVKQSLILTPVVVLTILFGLFPAPVIKVSETAVANTLKVLKVNDPAPRIEMVKQND
jgi:NADH-quinone oxidoreductase subunit M